MDEFLGTGDAARLLGVGVERVRQLAERGDLPVMRLLNGKRIFRKVDVEELRRVRERAKQREVDGNPEEAA